jgi:hypothetical protein
MRWWNKKDTVEDGLTLSISWFRKNNYLYGGKRYGGISWSNSWRGEKFANILFVIDVDEDDLPNNHIVLIYTSYGEDIRERIDIDTTPCNFGGVRYWFVCPSCNRRASKIHVAPGSRHFRCRNCADLTYRSCQESDKRVSALIRNPEMLKKMLDAGGKDWLLAMRAAIKCLEE